MHRPLIILASFVFIGFALFYFQPGVQRTEPAVEMSSIDDESTFAPEVSTQAPAALSSDVVTLTTVPSFTIDDTPSSPTIGGEETVLTPDFGQTPEGGNDVDVAVEAADQTPLASPGPNLVSEITAPVATLDSSPSFQMGTTQAAAPQALTSPTLSAPSRPNVATSAQLASPSLDAPSMPSVDTVLAEPAIEVTRAASPSVIENNPALSNAPEAQPLQPTLTASEINSGFFEKMGERPLLLTATISPQGIQPMPFDLEPLQAGTAPLIESAPIAEVASAATLAPATPSVAEPQVETPTFQTPIVAEIVENPIAAQILGDLTTHIVQPGDSLAKMAILYYGDKDGFVYIFEANRDKLARPEEITVGQTLTIPLVATYQ